MVDTVKQLSPKRGHNAEPDAIGRYRNPKNVPPNCKLPSAFLGKALIEHYEKVHKQVFKDEKACYWLMPALRYSYSEMSNNVQHI